MVDQGIPDQEKVGEKVPVACVAPRQVLVVPAGDTGPDPSQVGLQAVGHDGELAPVGLVDVATQALPHGAEPIVLVALQAVHEGGGGRAQGQGVAQHPRQLADPPQVFLQHQLVVHAHRQLGGLGLDEGVAVPIAADPGAEADEAGDPDAAGRSVGTANRPLQIPVDLRYRLEQGLPEEVEPLAHLIGDLGLVQPHVVGLPKDLDLGDDGLAPLLQLLLVELAPVQVPGDQEDAAEGLEDGAPLGLRGVRGEHRQIDQMLQQALEVLGSDAFVMELAHRVVQGAHPEPLARS